MANVVHKTRTYFARELTRGWILLKGILRQAIGQEGRPSIGGDKLSLISIIVILRAITGPSGDSPYASGGFFAIHDNWSTAQLARPPIVIHPRDSF